MKVQVLGSCCSRCEQTLALIREVAEQQGKVIELSKVEDVAEILSMGVMSTPGVVIDGEVVHSGSMPDRSTVADWLDRADTT
ncbi:MAG: thioredoxin family protein [Guyparkeria sp.]|uniref:thioredoxin family protein n=1 Tax=Guyparkeria sp. TaxID=2035736 RepID=UPI00397AD8E8